MTAQRAYYRRIFYGVIILVLLLPLYLLGRPATLRMTPDGLQVQQGGVLAKILAEEELASSQVGEIDPASSAIQLATFGLKGVAIAILWNQSQEFQKKRDWNNVIAASNQLIRLEPHFTSIWEFVSWQFAYNASAQFDDYRERYRWVIRGFDFVVDGTKYNRTSPILFHKAGWTISQRLGIADEKEQFRRLFREDDDFHTRYHTPSLAERDNWRIGRNWYLQSEDMVQNGANLGKMSEPLFYMHSRMNLIHYVQWRELEGFFGEDGQGEEIKALWDVAEQAWRDYGRKEFKTPIQKQDGTYWMTSFLRYDDCTEQIAELTKELQGLEPGLLERLVLENWEKLRERSNGEALQASLLEWLAEGGDQATIIRAYLDEKEPGWVDRFLEIQDQTRRAILGVDAGILEKPSVLLTDQEEAVVTNMGNVYQRLIGEARSQFHDFTVKLIVDNISDRDLRGRALEIQNEIAGLDLEKQVSQSIRELVNYPHRIREFRFEKQDDAIQARRKVFEGRKVFREGELSMSDRLWVEALQHWENMVETPEFGEMVKEDWLFTRDILEFLDRYVVILDAREKVFPEHYPLRAFVKRNLIRDMQYTGQDKKAEMLEELLEKGEYEQVMVGVKSLLQDLTTLNQINQHMKLGAVPEIKEASIKAVSVFVRCLMQLGQPIPKTLPDVTLRLYVDLMLKHDPLQWKAVELSNTGLSLCADEQYAASQQMLEQAVEQWNQVLHRYPLLYSQPSSVYYGVIGRVAQSYKKTLEMQGKGLPENFTLGMFL
ncbi:MAG: hypothetical protein ACRC10_10950 [Thermoguttaceae bacterium]